MGMRGLWGPGAVGVIGALAVAAGAGGSSSDWGSSDNSSGGSPATKSQGGGTVTVLMGTAPDYLDPQLGYTLQSFEGNWISYLGLYTYAHKSGQAGGKLIPALADGPPSITDNGKTYTMT